MRITNVAVALIVCAGSALSQGAATAKISFENKVWPIIQKSCLKCHQAPRKDKRGKLRKPKAGLRLDGAGWIMRGSDAERVLVPGKPDESPMYLRTTLDPDDEDIMPSAGRPLTKAQQSTFKKWIAQGADFGGWVGTGGPGGIAAASKTARFKIFKDVAKGLKTALPAAVAKVQQAVGNTCRIETVMPKNPLLRVDFVSNHSKVLDSSVEQLTSLSDHITHLALADTKVTDDGLATVGRMKRLTHLDLRKTAIGDEGIAKLAELNELRYLNIYGTQVSDASVEALGRLKQLQSLYVWKSKLTPAGVQRLQKLLPGAKISHQLDLPAPARDDGNNRRRGRRGKKK